MVSWFFYTRPLRNLPPLVSPYFMLSVCLTVVLVFVFFPSSWPYGKWIIPKWSVFCQVGITPLLWRGGGLCSLHFPVSAQFFPPGFFPPGFPPFLFQPKMGAYFSLGSCIFPHHFSANWIFHFFRTFFSHNLRMYFSSSSAINQPGFFLPALAKKPLLCVKTRHKIHKWWTLLTTMNVMPQSVFFSRIVGCNIIFKSMNFQNLRRFSSQKCETITILVWNRIFQKFYFFTPGIFFYFKNSNTG